MLSATDKEIERVKRYMQSEAPDLTVEFIQKVYSENVMKVRHDVWDVHTNVDRWWVITEPMNLYSQEQFPNMDYALSFHVGLCVRIPRSERQKLPDEPGEVFIACFRGLNEATEALGQAQEMADLQAIGVRCREVLLTFIDIVQRVVPWRATEQPPPKRADLKGWTDYFCSVALAGESQKNRRSLLKTLLESAWEFANWLTHTKSSTLYDAEAAIDVTENALGLCISAVIRHTRGVPEQCPACGSLQLSPARGFDDQDPDVLWEWPTCDKCDWAGEPVQIEPYVPHTRSRSATPHECVLPGTKPLRQLRRPEN